MQRFLLALQADSQTTKNLPTPSAADQFSAVTMLRRRQGQDLQAWVEAVEASAIPELRRFARGLLRDKAAVGAALTQNYSNGPTEAQVHKLKLVKRQMYGRGSLALLRQRLLHAV